MDHRSISEGYIGEEMTWIGWTAEGSFGVAFGMLLLDRGRGRNTAYGTRRKDA